MTAAIGALAFDYATLTTRRPASSTLAAALRLEAEPRLREAGGRFYAAFAPQFGLASNQLVWMTSWDRVEQVEGIDRVFAGLGHVERVDHHAVVPTARPRDDVAPEAPGIYVHRWFSLAPENVDEVVALSDAAWETFEKTFEVQVIGFFRTVDESRGQAELMLLNWYPSLAAWEDSRNFDADPESRRRFLRRAELTTGTRAISTRLLPLP